MNFQSKTSVKKRVRNHLPVNNDPSKLIRKIIAKRQRSNHSNSSQKNIIVNNTKLKNISYPNIKVATILDIIPTDWFRYECNSIPLSSDNWMNIIQKEKPHMLLVQSTWQDYKWDWKYKMINLHRSKDRTLRNLVNFCKSLNIPTVFWNIEDPYDFNTFLGAAKLFDYVFTSDSNSVPKYKQALGHNNVFTLPFAAQPKIHNPINKDIEKIGQVAFAGSWYRIGHEARKRDMEIVLKPATAYNFHIYDRMYSLTKDINFKFPDIYQKHMKGYLPYSKTNSTFKKYDVILNVNTVQNSPTMFSCRVFEALATGTNVISGYSLGINKLFPNIVLLSRNKNDTKLNLQKLLNNKDYRDKLSLLGQREVFNKHTYKDRFEKILDKVGIKYKKDTTPGVSIITSTIREENMENVFKNFNSQNYSKKELIVILNNNSMDIEKWRNKASIYKNIKIYRIDEKESLGKCLNFGIEKSKFNYVSKFDDDNYYAPNFLTDLMNAFKYTKADIVGKLSYYVYFEGSKTLAIRCVKKENRYIDFLSGSALIINKKVFNKVKFSNETIGEDTKFLKDCIKNNFKLYSADRFNYVCIRKPTAKNHTWKVPEKTMLKNCNIVCKCDDFKNIVTV
ncbi:MAG: glycosyltransferase [Firmicutes bacterium]|nr:glycosyltransferase [Bacillota bacterium]